MKTNKETGQVTAGSNFSYWSETSRQNKYTPLTMDTETDILIVGAGIAGLSIAYQLVKEGRKVIVVEDGIIGSGETGRTSAHLSAVLDTRYFELQTIYGKEQAKLIASSHMKAIDTIEEIIKAELIECDFKRLSGQLSLHETDKPESLAKEYHAAKEAGLDVTFQEFVCYFKNITGPCLEFKNQASFHPLKYINGLADAIVKKGGKIYTSTHAKSIDSTGAVTSEEYRITAKHIVVATNSPVNNKYMMHLHQFPYRTYVIGALIKKDSVSDLLFWDTGVQKKDASFQPYHYVRLSEYNTIYDLLICGGEDHPTGLIEATDYPEEKLKYKRLIQWVNERFPIESIAYEWSGQVLYSYDSLAFIGKNPFDHGNIYIVTGDCGNGLTYGVMAGSIIPDLINEKPNEFAELYKPSRCKLLKAGKIFLEEFIKGLTDYYKNKDPDIVDSIEMIAPGEGKIIEIDGSKYAVSRNNYEWLDLVSAECTHLGCTIKWNRDENSWDCPCHGSRFTQTGIVINGPANSNLNHYKIKATEFDKYKTQIKETL